LCTHTIPQSLPYRWAVIGAGPAGIIAVAVLLENKILPTDIVWFDPEFNVGRVGKYYRNVPANSRAHEMSAVLQSCTAFESCSSESIIAVHTMQSSAPFYLGIIADPLLEITHHFIKQGVVAIQEIVNHLSWQQEIWQITANQVKSTAHNIILAVGAQPKICDYQGPTLIPLDHAVDKECLAHALKPEDIVAVMGSGSSAMLLLKHLSELPVKQVINFYKHHHSFARQRSLIRGSTATWIEQVLDRQPPHNLIRILNTPENRSEYLPLCTKIIYAIGYERTPLPEIQGINAYSTSAQNGILGSHIFGIGFAFPEELNYTGATGMITVPFIGISSFMRFAKRVIPEWLK
jgi:cation diffusion facilitator CzcD-associated flavoprotein CzcO